MSGRSQTPAARRMRQFRALERGAGYRDRERARATARNEALSALSRRHPAEFAALNAAELEHMGLTEVEMQRPCSCGGVIIRRSPAGRFPSRCDSCKEAS